MMRIRKRPGTETQALEKISRITHWQQLDRHRRRHLLLSRAWVAVRDRWTQLRRDGGIAAGPVRDVLFATFGTAALVATGRHTFCRGTLFIPGDPNDYGGFVGVAVGAEAALLALLFTTVGGIASTAYARAPGEIRGLFVRERTSLINVRNVAVALDRRAAVLVARYSEGR